MFAILILLALQSGPLPHPLSARISAAVSEIDPSGPGAAIAVIHRGKPVALHFAGFANLDDRQPITADSRFYLGSLSKQFTAASLALLVLDQKLSLDHSVGRYVSSLPEPVASIPIHHLLHHTSGIRDYLKIRDLAGQKNDPFDNDDALRIIRAQRSLVFTPGDRYQYSNSNYILLAEVVKATSGRSLEEFARDRVFAPLGMTSTHFETDASSVVPARVVSYRRSRNGAWHRYVKQFEAIGDGGAYSSLRDLMRWDEIVRSRAHFPAGFFDILLERPAAGGTPYAGGLLIRPFLEQPAIEHSGFMLGFQHHYLRFPEADLAVIILTNNREIDSFELREKVTRTAFQVAAGKSLPDPTPVKGAAQRPSPPPALAPIDASAAGTFFNDEIPLRASLFVRDGNLHLDPASFRPFQLDRLSATTFTGLGGEVGVRLTEDANRWILTVRDLGEFVFVREQIPN